MDAGEITDIQVPRTPSGKFRLKLKVDQKFHPIIRKDSVATISTEGMVDNKFVDIGKGSDHSPECPPGGTLPSEEAVEMSELMRQGKALAKTAQETITDIRKPADGAIDNITHLLDMQIK